jgi:hypothetical protein
MVMLCRVEAGDAEDVEKIVTIVKCALDKSIDMPFEEIVGTQVVGTKHESIGGFGDK